METKPVIKEYDVKEELSNVRDVLKKLGCPLNSTKRVELGQVTSTHGIDLYLVKRILNAAKNTGVKTYTTMLDTFEERKVLSLIVGGTTYTINLHKM